MVTKPLTRTGVRQLLHRTHGQRVELYGAGAGRKSTRMGLGWVLSVDSETATLFSALTQTVATIPLDCIRNVEPVPYRFASPGPTCPNDGIPLTGGPTWYTCPAGHGVPAADLNREFCARTAA